MSPAARYWQLAGGLNLELARPRIMAIINTTPDSFFADSRFDPSSSQLNEQLARIAAQAPDIFDVGGQSTRPGSARVSAQDELARVLPVITRLRTIAPAIPVSIDTYHSWVAREAIAAGAAIVNDVSAGSFDPGLLDVVAEAGCGYVLMHMRGTPETMQDSPDYRDCVSEVGDFFEEKLAVLAARGIEQQSIVLDPGIGFGKRVEDNLALIAAAPQFAKLGRPLLYGISRKGFIGKLAAAADSPTETAQAKGGNPALADPAHRLPGTLGLTWELLDRGVMLHRAHDVAATQQLFAVWEATKVASGQQYWEFGTPP
jgi:dihydropteroate synthase